MSLVDRLIRNSSHSVIAGVASAAASFVASVVVARTLGVDGSASVAIALWIVFFATTVSDIGLTGSLARYMSHYSGASEADNLRRFVSSLLKTFLAAIGVGIIITITIIVNMASFAIGKLPAKWPEGTERRVLRLYDCSASGIKSAGSCRLKKSRQRLALGSG